MKLIDKEIPKSFENDVKKAVEILKNAGCTEIYIFGSLVNGNYNKESDIDIAVKGLPEGQYFKIGAKLNVELEHEFDLIKIDDMDNNFSNFIQEKEVFVRVA